MPSVVCQPHHEVWVALQIVEGHDTKLSDRVIFCDQKHDRHADIVQKSLAGKTLVKHCGRAISSSPCAHHLVKLTQTPNPAGIRADAAALPICLKLKLLGFKRTSDVCFDVVIVDAESLVAELGRSSIYVESAAYRHGSLDAAATLLAMSCKVPQQVVAAQRKGSCVDLGFLSETRSNLIARLL